MTIMVSKRRPQPEGYIRETAEINARKAQYENKVHKFVPAKWTHPNGHPRCKMCGQEQPIASDCNREATPEEEAALQAEFDQMLGKVSKANPKWDGDGVQGAGQPRDRRGRWVELPGPTDISRIGAFELDDGTVGVFKDNDRRPMKTYKNPDNANRMVAEAIKADAREYKNAQRRRARANKRIRERAEADRARKEAGEAERQKEEVARQRKEQKIYGPQKGKKAKPKGVPKAEKKPRGTVTYSEVDRIPNPGNATQREVDAAKAWAKENLPDNEAKYSGLIARLLQRRKITQDPSMRGELSDRYGISPKRLVEIEQGTYNAMFPQAEKKTRTPDLRGQGREITRQQEEAMKKLGARRAFPESDNPDRPSRYFKIQKGPQRGKWAKVSWNGSVDVVPKREAEREEKRSKVAWTKRLLENKKAAADRRAKMKAAQVDINDLDLDRRAQKEARIRAAKKWANENGLDPDDSYWWAFFWNDNSLLKAQHDETDFPMSVALAEVVNREKMDPALLERLLALPDIDARDMRGHRPEGRRAKPGDEDFEEASAESRRTDPEWEAQQREREVGHERRIKAAWNRYKKRYPNSKKTFEEFKNDYYNERMRIPGGSRRGISKSKPRWDGDGVQAPGQPRDRTGRWSRSGSLAAAATGMGLVERGTMQHHGATTSRRASSSAFDARNKTIAAHLKINKPQKGSTHQQMAYNSKTGKSVPAKKTKKNWTPEQAYYARNNGTTKISDKRLVEIFQDRSKITATENDLINSAKGDARFDGDKRLKFKSVKAGGAQREMARWEFFKNLRTQLGQDYAKERGWAEKGKGGQVRTRGDAQARRQNEKDNEKRAINERNKADSPAVRKQLLLDFGDGVEAKCIFCGKMVNFAQVSPERMMPGKRPKRNSKGEIVLGKDNKPIMLDWGKYERGNMAPAHVKCNTSMGTAAQYKPEEYYEKMMSQFLKHYDDWIQEGYLGFVFQKHRSKLRRGKGRR